MELRPATLVFKVHRREPELISPAKPTPRELMILSDIDDQDYLRNHLRMILFYKHDPSLMIKGNNNTNNDPVKVIRKVLAETLFYYYPVAGRLREGPHGKIMVECNGKGVVFVEADADVALEEFGDILHPPFPCSEELYAECSIGGLNSPLLLMQVTRLKCSGFILAFSFTHTMFDGVGVRLFLKTMEELASGANAPSVPPTWDRHLLSAKVSARAPHVHREYDGVVRDINHINPHSRTVQRSFFFGPKEISAVYRLVPADLRDHITTFELLTSLLWRSRTIAMSPFSNTKARVMMVVNVRPLFSNPPLPPGYYGNAIVFTVAKTTAEELSKHPLGYALRLVHEAKSGVTYEHVRSTMDGLATTRRLHFVAGDYVVSDTRRLGFDEINFGWGRPVYAGPMEGRLGDFDGVSFFIPRKNKKGGIGIVVPIILPAPAMERFVEELARIFDNEYVSCEGSNNTKSMRSSL